MFTCGLFCLLLTGQCATALASWDQPGGSAVTGSVSARTEAPALVDFGGRGYVAWSERGDGRRWELRVDRLTAGGWQQVGGALNRDDTLRAVRPSLAVGVGGLYAAWEEFGGGTWHIWVSVLDGNSWRAVGGDLNTSGARAVQPRIASIAGTLYVVFGPTVNGTPQIQVDRFDGSDWQQVGAYLNRDSADPAHWANLADSNGTPYVAWEETSAGTSHVVVDRLVGADWQPVGTELREPNTAAAYQPVLTSVNGIPYVAWEENEYGSTLWHTWVSSFDGTSWQIPDEMRSPHAPNALGPNITTIHGAPYVTWEEYGGGTWHIRVATLGATGWQIVSGALNTAPYVHSIRPAIALVDGYPFAAWNEYAGSDVQVHTGRLVPDFTTTITLHGHVAMLTSQVQRYDFSYAVGFQHGPGTSMVHSTPPTSLSNGPVSLHARLGHLRVGTPYSYRPYIRMGTDQPLAYGPTRTYTLRPSAPFLRILSRAVKVDRRGVAKVKVKCPPHGARCEGHLTLSTSVRVRHRRSRTVMLGRRAFKASDGRRFTVALRLHKPALRMVRARRSTHGLLTAVDSVKGPAVRLRATRKKVIRLRG